MSLEKDKEFCNKKFKEAIVYARKKDVKKCREALFVVMESLLKISYQLSGAEKLDCEQKIKFILDIAKTIADDGFTEDVMFNLTGEVPAKDEIKTEKLEVETNIQQETVEDELEDNFEENTTNNPLRPTRLRDYVGQDKVKRLLAEAILAARTKQTSLDHVLLFGSAGLGKTTLARIIANEMKSNIIVMNGPTIKDTNDFIKNIKQLKENDIVFIDEIHRISTSAAESIYTAMEDFKISYFRNDGKNVELDLPKFTLIGATTHSGLLEKPMRDRFALQYRLEPYSVEVLTQLGIRSFEKLGFMISEKDMKNIAKRSRGVPRICNSFIKRISDKALIRNIKQIDDKVINEYFADNEIDNLGLNAGDINVLKTIINKFGGGPVGLDTLASATGEGKNIIENQYEPYLIYLGFINITPNGRVATELAYKHLKIEKH